MVLDKKLTELQQIHEIDSNQNSKVHESSSPCNMNELQERGMIINDVNQERYDTQDDLIKNLSAEGLKIIKAMDDQIEARMFYEKENKPLRQMGFTEREKMPWRQHRNHRRNHSFTAPNDGFVYEIL